MLHSCSVRFQAGVSLPQCELCARRHTLGAVRGEKPPSARAASGAPVSYTHLTLPTICSV
eukprot:3816203-Alexandrium_andersonii.AAC.1